jgi:multicomponent Na+:H+ antiporter subunit G
MLELFNAVLGYCFIITGVFFIFTGSLGLMRMPDFFTRLHPAGLTDSFGAPLVLIGVAIQDGFTLYSAKLLLLIFFILITTPTATHALAKAALFFGIKPILKDKK